MPPSTFYSTVYITATNSLPEATSAEITTLVQTSVKPASTLVLIETTSYALTEITSLVSTLPAETSYLYSTATLT